MLSFCVSDQDESRRDEGHGRQIITRRVMGRDRGAVSRVPAIARWRPTTQGGTNRATAPLFVLKKRIAWEDLPQEAFQCSYKTCTR